MNKIFNLLYYKYRSLVVTYVMYKFTSILKRRLSDTTKVKSDSGIKVTVPPIIVIGMHRSGTTLLARIMRILGVKMGRIRGKDTDESLFFQALNKAIINACHSEWDNLHGFREVYSQPTIQSALTTSLLEVMQSGASTLHGQMKATIWGWKDPKNTVTLDLWKEVFPNAKIIFIYRNGVDVANSLVNRSMKSLSLRTMQHQHGFKLWKEYNMLAMAHYNAWDHEKRHLIKYEDLLQNPQSIISDLVAFLELNSDDTTIEKACALPRSPSNKPKKTEQEISSEILNDELMIKWGYV
ncbi:MAG: sulfotransferase [Marinoscillum sp.]